MKALVESLPSYMIPTIYMPVEVIPKLPSEKIDRIRLREMGRALSRQDIAYLERGDGERSQPKTEAELLMQDLYAAAIGIEKDSISIDDSFFSLGGDSIGAMRLASLARQHGISLQVRDVFQDHILRDIATLV